MPLPWQQASVRPDHATRMSASSSSRSAEDLAALLPPHKRKNSAAAMNMHGVTARLFGLFVFIVIACTIGLISVAYVIQQRDVLNGANALRGGHAVDAETNNALTPAAPAKKLPEASPEPRLVKLPVEERWRKLGNLSEYECVGWRGRKDCSPSSVMDETRDAACNATINDGVAGYCEIRHSSTGKIQRVMEMDCDSLRPGVQFQCQDFAAILDYGRKAPEYVHDAGFSFEQCQQDLVTDQMVAGLNPSAVEGSVRYDKGIVIVIYSKMLQSVYASIRSLRAMGSTLPVELWYIASETNVTNPLLLELTTKHGAYLREIKDPRASKFYTKVYAVFYSAFDQVLLLDADNFAVRDPTYLFSTPEFQDKGAIFWPDFWRPKKTIFNIQPTSFVWDVFDLDYVDMFEQESGQVVVDRRRHMKAMNVMMYYAFHPQLIEAMRLVWGDKDLFRFAWMKTNSSFHMIAMPPGAAGLKLPDKNIFCGVTMVQHDPAHEILFLHRNQEKLSSANKRIVWDHIQDFKMGAADLSIYDVRGANGGRYYPQFTRCYGKDIYYEKAFTVRPIEELPFADLEKNLLEFVAEAATFYVPPTEAPPAETTAAPQ